MTSRSSKPKRQPNLDLRWTPITAGPDFELLYAYNKQDVRAELEASSRIPDLTPRELAIWRFDQRCNRRGMAINRKGVDDCIVIMEQAYARYNAELREITNHAVDGASEATGLLAWCRSQGVYLPDLDEETLGEACKRTDYPPGVSRALRIRQLLAFGSVKKLYAFKYQTGSDGRLRDQYTYHGAHTSLWNGRGVQPANLYKGIFSKPWQAARAFEIVACGSLELVEQEFGVGSEWCENGFERYGPPGTKGSKQAPADGLEVVASLLRSLIVAEPGSRLMSADFTSIQAVVTAALAGEQWRLKVFREKKDLYYMQAAMLTGKSYEWYQQWRKENGGKHHPDRQTYGKIPVLSADFGAWIGGWKKFGADKLGDDAYIKKLILQTRASIPNTVEMWGGQTRDKFQRSCRRELFGLEGAALSAILDPGNCYAYRQVAYQMHEDILYSRGPSGFGPLYHAPRVTNAEPRGNYIPEPWELAMTYEGWNSNATKGEQGWQRMSLYGGVQTQNIVSHESREIQADALLRLEAHGYPIVMHTHDENVTERKYGEGSLDEYIGLVRILPEWAREIDGTPWPINVPDAWESEAYGKWE
jgi:DNA polymerase